MGINFFRIVLSLLVVTVPFSIAIIAKLANSKRLFCKNVRPHECPRFDLRLSSSFAALRDRVSPTLFNNLIPLFIREISRPCRLRFEKCTPRRGVLAQSR